MMLKQLSRLKVYIQIFSVIYEQENIQGSCTYKMLEITEVVSQLPCSKNYET
jgi:hypothetical protein